MSGMIEKAMFGFAHHESSRVIFGGAALAGAERPQAEKAFRVLKRYGVNHIDTSVSYGAADRRIGEQIAGERHDWFLAGKIDARTWDDAWEELRRSLEDLGTDHFDLLQMHELVADRDVERFLGGDGAAGVLLKAQKLGMARHIGVTGHAYDAPRLLGKCVKALPLDSVLLPWNYALSRNEGYSRDFSALAAACREKGIAVQTIKSIARSSWGSAEQTRATWYRPLEEPADIDRAVWWLMGHKDFFLCSPGDLDLLPFVLDAAERFSGVPSDAEMEEMCGRLGIEMPEPGDWPRMQGG
jgi:aryl-alcohol dehydrogenase-like predicted oxidoreductase